MARTSSILLVLTGAVALLDRWNPLSSQDHIRRTGLVEAFVAPSPLSLRSSCPSHSLRLQATSAVPNPFKKLPWNVEKERQRESRRLKTERAKLHRELGIAEDATYEEIVAATDTLIARAAGDLKRKIQIEVTKDKILQIRLNERLAGLAAQSKEARAQSTYELEGYVAIEFDCLYLEPVQEFGFSVSSSSHTLSFTHITPVVCRWHVSLLQGRRGCTCQQGLQGVERTQMDARSGCQTRRSSCEIAGSIVGCHYGRRSRVSSRARLLGSFYVARVCRAIDVSGNAQGGTRSRRVGREFQRRTRRGASQGGLWFGLFYVGAGRDSHLFAPSHMGSRATLDALSCLFVAKSHFRHRVLLPATVQGIDVSCTVEHLSNRVPVP